MAQIRFFINAGSDFNIDTSGSGLGFYGDDGFGASVAVGDWQGRTFVTDSNGVTKGPECRNVKYLNAGSGILGTTGSGIGLKAIPNFQGTLNIRFAHSSAVKVQNVKVRAYDRVNIDNAPSGLVVKFAELIHPDQVIGPGGSGDSQWITIQGSSVIATLANSPGISGLYAADGSSSTRPDSRHDWYCAISCSPSSVGSKKAALYVELEYL